MRIVKSAGYLAVHLPNHPRAWKQGFVLQHRLVMEQVLGRHLNDNEVVHHKNGNKHDNRPENLELMTSAEHSRLHHRTGRTLVTLACELCSKVFDREKRATYDKKYHFCSRACIGKWTVLRRAWRPKRGLGIGVVPCPSKAERRVQIS
jgi:HNH endonuclease